MFAVDDSRMILNIYRSVLHKLGCKPVLFEFPAEAIKQVETQIPIVMVTTQNECQDNGAAYDAGINDILQKPFNEETLGAAMEKYLIKNWGKY